VAIYFDADELLDPRDAIRVIHARRFPLAMPTSLLDDRGGPYAQAGRRRSDALKLASSIGT